MINRPMIFIAATKPGDKFYMPSTGMWEHLKKKIMVKGSINLDESFYCGSFAGRPFVRGKTRREDYSDSDLMFAKHLGIRFFTPEVFFLHEEPFGIGTVDYKER